MIRGPSGGGKTTMLNLIGTIDSSTGGELLIMGQKIDKDSSDDFLSQLRLKHIGFVFQTFNLLATMSALENVELPMILLGKHDDKERKRRQSLCLREWVSAIDLTICHQNCLAVNSKELPSLEHLLMSLIFFFLMNQQVIQTQGRQVSTIRINLNYSCNHGLDLEHQQSGPSGRG